MGLSGVCVHVSIQFGANLQSGACFWATQLTMPGVIHRMLPVISPIGEQFHAGALAQKANTLSNPHSFSASLMTTVSDSCLCRSGAR